MSNRNYQLVEPFDIDHGQLDGISAHKAFILGVEWLQFLSELRERSERFTTLVHVENEQRVLKLAYRNGRKAVAKALDNTWVKIEVEPKVVN